MVVVGRARSNGGASGADGALRLDPGQPNPTRTPDPYRSLRVTARGTGYSANTALSDPTQSVGVASPPVMPGPRAVTPFEDSHTPCIIIFHMESLGVDAEVILTRPE